ncbi:hypothetical protein KFK09_019437 [Dendrobium nobile]|uniref:DUF4283 domain-containing protein n=1 Tax=Dendrobium nobile TaxID=94219 RepID=A0A8T3AQ91_DENNO|nr:hypothetical protein KFK09_019437 [Dendrobium nobile]
MNSLLLASPQAQVLSPVMEKSKGKASPFCVCLVTWKKEKGEEERKREKILLHRGREKQKMDGWMVRVFRANERLKKEVSRLLRSWRRVTGLLWPVVRSTSGFLLQEDLTLQFIRSHCLHRHLEMGKLALLKEPEPLESVFSNGPWYVNGHIIGIDKWSPTFSPTSLKGLTAPIWIRMPNLPLQCWE